MPVITLTTEWQSNDFYYGIIKGRLCTLCPGATIIDNAFGIPVFNIAHASFVIRNTYASYPSGSIHIICVHSEAGSNSSHLIVRLKDHYFIGADNGIFSLILNSEPDEIVRIEYAGSDSELEIFARAAADLYSGKKMSQIGAGISATAERIPLRATIDRDVIAGSVIFIDSYGNAISNITREVFHRVFEGKRFRILIHSNSNYTEHISEKYSDVPVGDMLARFNNLDLLEIAINGANISELLSLDIGSVVRVDTTDKCSPPDRLF